MEQFLADKGEVLYILYILENQHGKGDYYVR